MRHSISVRKSLPPFKTLLFIGLTTALFFAGFFFLYRQFMIRIVVIEGVSPSQTVQGTDSIRNENVYLLDAARVRKTIIAQNPEIRSVTIIKRFPNTIVLNITTYAPFAQMQTNAGYLLLSDDGRVLAKTTSGRYHVPLINYYQKIDNYSVTSGDWIRYDDVQKALHFLKAMNGLGLNVDTIDINGDNMILCSLGKKRIVFSTEITTSIQDYELEKVIEQLKIEGKEFTSLDLRFDKPVVTF